MSTTQPEECEGFRMVGRKDWGDHPLAHEDGIAVIGQMLALATQTVTVICSGCSWRGRRRGGPFFADSKPCPRCGETTAVSERSRARLLRPVTDEEREALECAEAKYAERPSYEEAHGVV